MISPELLASPLHFQGPIAISLTPSPARDIPLPILPPAGLPTFHCQIHLLPFTPLPTLYSSASFSPFPAPFWSPVVPWLSNPIIIWNWTDAACQCWVIKPQLDAVLRYFCAMSVAARTPVLPPLSFLLFIPSFSAQTMKTDHCKNETQLLW